MEFEKLQPDEFGDLYIFIHPTREDNGVLAGEEINTLQEGEKEPKSKGKK